MYAYEAFTPVDKAEFHRRRLELGQQMACRLATRTLYEGHDTVHGRDAIDLDDMRKAVWQAEYDALQADPKEVFLPGGIRRQLNQGMSE